MSCIDREHQEWGYCLHCGERLHSKGFVRRYAQRAGVEGALSQAIRAFGLRHSRYIGFAKTYLQHIGTATAINLVRLWHWRQGVPKEPTPISRLKLLAPTA